MGEVGTDSPWFAEFGTGASFSNAASINYHPNYNIWPVANYDSSLGTVPLYMAGIGYKVSPLFKVDGSYSYRGQYRYSKHFERLNNPSGVSLQPNTRSFNLNANSLLFSGTFYLKGLESFYPTLPKIFVNNLGSFGTVQPIIGGGIGVSYNTVTNFQTITDNTNWITNVKQDKTLASFAWQLNAGVDWQISERFSFDIGYRYFNAGRFNSSDACDSRLNSSNGDYVTPAWSPNWQATLSANEVYFTSKVNF